MTPDRPGHHRPAVAALAPLLIAPATTAVLTDFDGTLSPIVDDPDRAVALPGAAATLARLARHFAAVAVVSGRPVTFLAEALPAAGPDVQMFGVYGLEWRSGHQVVVAPEAEPWLAPVAAVAAAARSQCPPGVGVEWKGPALAIHWRRAPGAGPWAETFAARWAAATGLLVQPGRRALELRPPLAIDKGQVVHKVAGGGTAACFAGDDAGDLPAFAALDALADRGLHTVRLAVADSESPPALVAAADIVVDSPAAALVLLDALADGAEAGAR
jgi:trehalose 6-phosphate phosphatase